MYYRIFLFYFLPWFTLISTAQYSPQSPYLINPDKNIGYIDSCATFWLNSYDDVLGGFFTEVDKFGNVLNFNSKAMLTQSRNAYGLIRAFMVTGDTTYLNYAETTLNFLYQYCWDNNNGGWYAHLNRYGNPTNSTADKTAFNQHYAILGPAAMAEATGDSNAWHWLIKGYQHLENVYWDTHFSYSGYFDIANYTNTNVQNKSFNATVDAITTHLLYLYLLTGDMAYADRLTALSDQIINHLIGSMPAQAIGFVELFDSQWHWDNSNTMTIMGHVLKAGWCLARIQQILPHLNLTAPAEFLVNDVLQNGYDHEYGGPYKDYNRVTGQMLMWGNPDTTKAWWQMEQAIVAGLQLYQLTENSNYIQMSDETLNFFMKYFVDHQYGEVYADRTRYGQFAWSEQKGSDYKGAYHSIELGYYAYLYGNLFVLHQPVSLHYQFSAANAARHILLNPIAINDSLLRIKAVTKNGQIYTDFDPVNRTLHLAANTSGHFIVTYESADPATAIAKSNAVRAGSFTLEDAYPNPFNSSTTIRFNLSRKDYISLKIFNIRGEEITTLAEGYMPSGSHHFKWNAHNYASGVYFYRLKTKEASQTKRILLLK